MNKLLLEDSGDTEALFWHITNFACNPSFEPNCLIARNIPCNMNYLNHSYRTVLADGLTVFF